MISQKRNAIPGLAKVLLAAILIGCLLFAREVQRVKERKYHIDLNRPVAFPVRIGDESLSVSLSVSSRWPTAAAPNMIAGWRVPLAGSRDTALLYLDAAGQQPSEGQEFLAFLGHYIPRQYLYLPSLRVEEGPVVRSWTTVNISALYQDGRGVKALVMTLIYLPDGASVVLLCIGPESASSTLSLWLEEIAATVNTATPEKQTRSPAAPTPDGPNLQTSGWKTRDDGLSARPGCPNFGRRPLNARNV